MEEMQEDGKIDGSHGMNIKVDTTFGQDLPRNDGDVRTPKRSNGA